MLPPFIKPILLYKKKTWKEFETFRSIIQYNVYSQPIRSRVLVPAFHYRKLPRSSIESAGPVPLGKKRNRKGRKKRERERERRRATPSRSRLVKCRNFSRAFCALLLPSPPPGPLKRPYKFMACIRTICVHTTLNKSDSAAACVSVCAFARLFARVCTPGIMNMYGSLCGRYARVLFPPACVRKIKGCRPPSFSPLPSSPACLRSSAAANRPPPSLRSTLPPLSFSCSVYLFPSQKSRLTLTLAQYISLLSLPAVPLAPRRLSTHPPPPPPSSSTSFARVYITRACACCLSLSFVSSSISSCARNVVGRDFLRRGNLSEFIICRNRRS